MEQDLLTSLGIKATKQRKVIVSILESSDEPITAEGIYDAIDKEEGINFSTVYRTLSKLAEKGVLTKLGDPGGKLYFELKNKEKAHAHEIECVVCHKRIEITKCPMENFSRTLNKETGFVVTEHSMQVKGICANCAHKNNKHI